MTAALDIGFPHRCPQRQAVRSIPDVKVQLNALATETGRAADAFVQDAMAGSFDELAGVRGMVDSRHNEIQSGKVKSMDREAFFKRLY